jgi:S-adenosylmethionine:tRNA ribosyltransferase-isomerase
MRVDEFDFDLPEELIALRPARPRDSARLLVIGPGQNKFADRGVRDLADYLREGDRLVFNDTRVIPARLFGKRRRGDAEARIEALLHKRESSESWRAFTRPAKKLNLGERIEFADGLSAVVEEKGEGGETLLRFSCMGAELDQAISRAGEMPLPPYIAKKREADALDDSDYQTLFAQTSGAVAAPTAGLHFTPELMKSLEDKGIGFTRLTLHVGAGTFLPVAADDTTGHKMHAEWGEISPEAAQSLNAVKARGGRIVPIGTTSLRLLETASRLTGEVMPFRGDTDIFITPGYRFRSVDMLMTNFHLPRSTLFMLVSALRSLPEMQRAYAHAIAERYRFYSYGDACLIHRGETA